MVQGRTGPALTVDVVIRFPNGEIVLVKRKNEPFQGKWALPGGFVEVGETVENAAKREGQEETGLTVELEGLLGVYSSPERDPRGHTASVVFRAKPVSGTLAANTDAAEAVAFGNPLEQELAFDHREIIQDALRHAD